MPVVRFVTEEEIQAAADEGGFVVTFRKVYLPNRTGFTVKTQLVVTKTRKGERVEEVVEWKPNDCPPFRAVICGLFGDRKGFVWTNGQNMYNGQDEVIEAKQEERAPKVLSKDHLAALQEGRKRAREAAKQLPETPAPKVVTLPSDGNDLFKQGFYREACRKCGKGIKRTGRKGRAPTTHPEGECT